MAVGVLCPVRIHMGFIVAVVRVWAMVVEVCFSVVVNLIMSEEYMSIAVNF